MGRRLQQVREFRGLTREQVSVKIRKNAHTLYRWEKGMAEPPFEVLARLCRMYGVTVARVMDPRNAKPSL